VPIREFTFTVDLPGSGTRLDRALRAHFPWRSREHFQGMIDRGDVTVNGAARKASLRLREGDLVAVAIAVPADAPEKESAEGLVVLHEDDALVAIDKPSGVVAHPTGRIRHGTLINRLHARYRRTDAAGAPSAASGAGPAEKDVVPRLAHRLDKDTSGVVLVVKDRKLDAAVTRAFFRREVEKTYLALVVGDPATDGGLIDRPIGPAPDAQTLLEMTVRDDGQPSRTRWRVLERFGRFAFLELSPLTGRTHQLRVHLRSIGHPIVADHLYGDPRPVHLSACRPGVSAQDDVVVLDRLALHAHRLVLAHPVTGRPLSIVSPLPGDLVRTLAALREASAAASAGGAREARRAPRVRRAGGAS